MPKSPISWQIAHHLIFYLLDENNRGKISKIDLKNEIYPVWQGLKDDYQTYCGIVSFSKGSKDNA